MKPQWSILLSLLFALIIALFAVVNVGAVPVNYIVGEADLPLIIVILSSALFGGIAVGIFGIVRQYKLTRRIRELEKRLAAAAETPTTAPLPTTLDTHDEASSTSELKSE